MIIRICNLRVPAFAFLGPGTFTNSTGGEYHTPHSIGFKFPVTDALLFVTDDDVPQANHAPLRYLA